MYQKNWIVHCGKPSNNHTRNLEYFSRYTKRPPIADSKIKNYDGNYVTFSFRDHKTGAYKDDKIHVFEFIKRFIQHIPDVGFRMIRYYGLLANRVRLKALDIVAKLLGAIKKTILEKIDYPTLFYQSFGRNPLICPLCRSELLFYCREIVHNLLNKTSLFPK